MKEKAHLGRRWSFIYIAQLISIQLILYGTLIIGKIICENMNRTWYSEDILYIFLKWIEENQIGIICFIMLVSAVLLAFYRFGVIANEMKKIFCAVDNIYQNKDENVSLPIELWNIENLLNELRIKNKTDKQAAKEANQRKNELIMYMAHDLKTPLTSIIGYLTLACEEPEIPWEVKEKYMNIALKKSHRLEELTNEFFDITRFNFSHMILEKSRVNISMMMQQIVSEFMTEFNKKGLDIECCVEQDCYILCDTDKMERVFDNMIKNMINYSYQDSIIKINLRKSQRDSIVIQTQNHGKTIPKEMQERIFEQFFRMDSSRTAESGGSGLGLAVAKEIVTLHEGTISCHSENEIIKFKIVLPGCVN